MGEGEGEFHFDRLSLSCLRDTQVEVQEIVDGSQGWRERCSGLLRTWQEGSGGDKERRRPRTRRHHQGRAQRAPSEAMGVIQRVEGNPGECGVLGRE